MKSAIKGETTSIEPTPEFDFQPKQLKQWRDQLLESATGEFGKTRRSEPEPAIDVKRLHAWHPEPTLEKGSLSGATGKTGPLSRCLAGS